MRRAIGVCFWVCLLFGSCIRYEERYSLLSDKMRDSIVIRDGVSMTGISDDITVDDISSKKGIQFLKLKMMGLTLSGEYEKAYLVVNTYIQKFDSDPELIVAKGLLAEITNRDGKPYFQKGLDVLNKESMSELRETDKVLYIYILCLIKGPGFRNQVDNISSLLHPQDRGVADYFLKMKREDLLFAPPFSFVRRSIVNPVSNPEDGIWWK